MLLYCSHLVLLLVARESNTGHLCLQLLHLDVYVFNLYLSLATHDQLTESIVDELILRLEERECNVLPYTTDKYSLLCSS